MRKIHLIRHGTTEANLLKKYYGSTDLPLSNQGVDGVLEMARKGVYPDAEKAVCYTTGLARTEQTFFLIYGTREHGQIPQLREYHFGDFEMKTHEELKEQEDYLRWINDEAGETLCPNGESLRDFKDRVHKGFTALLQSGAEEIIVVCHGGVISAIMHFCFPEDERNVFQWQPDPGKGYTISAEGPRLVSFVGIG